MIDLGPKLNKTIADDARKLLDVQCGKLEELAKLHDMQKEEALDQTEYFHTPEAYYTSEMTWDMIVECGTPLCSLGWASQRFEAIKEGLKNNNQTQTSMNFLGITASTFDNLFGSTPRTPVEQASVIRDVIHNKRYVGGVD